MTTTTIVTDHAQTVNLNDYVSGDGVNFVDLNGDLVDFYYEKITFGSACIKHYELQHHPCTCYGMYTTFD